MEKDLKWIKKHYGEKFSHLCRELFPTILDTEGLLPKILENSFLPSRELYDDITSRDLTAEFKNYVYSQANVENKYGKKTNLSPEELMDRAGYILYPECQTEKDIQSFRHYYYRGEPTPKYTGGTPAYREGEELCTFNGGRLNTCRVWFAVRKDVDKIKRKDFKNPRREDDYGTSVISIQFTKTKPSTLSIKNRYNHTIHDVNPDATFSNNLDNIIEGLTQAFTDKYNIKLSNKKINPLEIPDYVQMGDGKFYKYNFEIDNVYYCPNNIIIDNGEVKQFNKDKFIVLENFILDIENKELKQYTLGRADSYTDSFIESVGKIKNIKRIPSKDGLTIQITPEEGELVEIKLDNHNQIVGYSNPNIIKIYDNFLLVNRSLTELYLPNVQQIGDSFLRYNKSLTKLELPNVQQIDGGFLLNNKSLTELNLPNVQYIARWFLESNNSLTKLELPNVRQIGDCFLRYNESLTELNLPNVREIGDYFLRYNESLTELNLPNVQQIGGDFLFYNGSLTELNLPNVQQIGDNFLYNNNSLTKLELPNVQQIGVNFLRYNESLTELYLPNVQKIGNDFLLGNNSLKELNLPNVQQIGDDFLYNNKSLKSLELPNVQQIGGDFLFYNRSLTELNLPNVQKIGNSFLHFNESLTELNLPNVQKIGAFFLLNNKSLTELNLPNIQQIGRNFLNNNRSLTELELPNVQQIGDDLLTNNNSLTKLELPPKFSELKNELLGRAKNTTEKI